jgi:hypothetical protein
MSTRLPVAAGRLVPVTTILTVCLPAVAKVLLQAIWQVLVKVA